MKQWKITPLDVGSLSLAQSHVLADGSDPSVRIEFALVSFLLQSGGRNVLVDLGPKTLEYTNDMFRRYGFFRVLPDGTTPDDVVQKQGNVLDHLRRHNLTPGEITDIIFTHLHADHHGMDDATDGGACEDFPNAVFHISKVGWEHNISRRVDGQWHSYVDFAFGDCMMRKMVAGKMIPSDNSEIAPGLSTVYLGGHSECSQGVRVETANGIVIIGSDDFYHYKLMEAGVIGQLCTTRERMVESNGRLADWALDGATIVPVHDPTVTELYAVHGDDWLVHARALSLEAARGFRSVWPSGGAARIKRR